MNPIKNLKPFTVFSFIVIVIFFINQNIFAAAPITHVVLAQKWIQHKENYTEAEKQAFMIGTLFPDIRYLRVIARTETHEKGLTIEELEKPQDAFTKGKRFHSYVDETREKLIKKWGIYKKFNDKLIGENKGIFLKFLEDEVLFKTQDWSVIVKYFSVLHEGEQKFGISDENLHKWHQHQMMALSGPPSMYLSFFNMLNKGYGKISAETIDKWSNELPKLAQDETIKQYVNDLVNEFDKMLGGDKP